MKVCACLWVYQSCYSTSTNLESVPETLHDWAVTSLSEAQRCKGIAKLMGKKTMCTAKDFIPLVHAGKLAKPVSASGKGDGYMLSESLADAVKSPRTSELSFVWQECREATP